jgi:ribosomal protein S18 acetylase RimI-like enzyme
MNGRGQEQEMRTAISHLRREKDYIFYTNYHFRAQRSLFLVDDRVRTNVLLGAYLKGLPFHAFTFHLCGEQAMSLEPMLRRYKHELGFPAHEKLSGVITIPEEYIDLLAIPNVKSSKTMLLMKWRNCPLLLPQGTSRMLAESDWEAVQSFIAEVGMLAFRREELAEAPHIGAFDDAGELVAMAGFHVYEDEYVEIGNIATRPGQRGRGLGSRITSDVCRLALDKSPHVYLCVFEENMPARRVYEKLGFGTVARFRFVECLW